ncbi:hypothetical protein H4218_005729 [Coemansia sp. IMI 209128]|nr:hypothetical protein H4218_005729 [Coemansia sp. IMI 209128]
MVGGLVRAGFTRGQAAAVVAVVRGRVEARVGEVRGAMLTKGDLENDAYLFRAALGELRMEMQMTRKNDQSLLESQSAAVSREIESLFQRTNDQIANLRSDIAIEMNNHRHDSGLVMKGMDMELHELATKYQMLMGEMKTDIEAIKLGSIRRGLITVVMTALFLSAVFWGPRMVKRVKKEEVEAVVEPVVDDVVDNVAETGVGYRDFSHLDIRYQPTTGSDDWIDATELASEEGDSQTSSTFWKH